MTLKHAKTVTIPDPTQAELDAQIALGNYPPGTLLADIALQSDFNADHVTNFTNSPVVANGSGSLEAMVVGSGLSYNSGTKTLTCTVSGGSVSDGDKGDITVSSSGTVWTIDNGAVTLAKQADVATNTVFYRKTAGAGAPEVQTIATLKTDLGLSGTNTGDQTSIVGITGTKAQFDTACTDGNFLYVGDVTQYTDEMAQDAVGAMVDSTIIYTDATPLLSRAALTGAITASAGSNATSLGSFTKAQLDAAVSDGNVLYVGDITQYTDELAQDAVGTILTDSSTIDFTYNDVANTITAAVIANTSTQRVEVVKNSGAVVGTRKQLNFIEGSNVTLTIADDAGGDQVDITIAAAGGGGGVSDGDKGDITVSSSGTVWTIDNDVVTYAKMQNVSATSRFLGRITAGAGDTEELTGTQATTLLDTFTSGLKGLAPPSGGGTTNFLRADGNWAAPSGGGSGLDHPQVMARIALGF